MKKIIASFFVIFLFGTSTISIADSSLDSAFNRGINKGLNSIGDYVTSILPGEGDTEVTIWSQEEYNLRYSILAVRPLAINPYSALPNKHLYFTQLRLANHEPFANGDQRVLFNGGLGFRTLVNDGNAILGVNAFYDFEFEQESQRGSIGIEYLANAFELYANVYDRLSQKSTYSSYEEEVVNGYDYHIVGQVPYMPWAKVLYKGYNWDQTGTDLSGKTIGLEAQLFQSLVFEYGQNDQKNLGNEDYYKLTFRWPANHLTPTLFTHTVTDYAFPVKNMENEMLHKVRRTNNIITEKRSSGVVIARGT